MSDENEERPVEEGRPEDEDASSGDNPKAEDASSEDASSGDSPKADDASSGGNPPAETGNLEVDEDRHTTGDREAPLSGLRDRVARERAEDEGGAEEDPAFEELFTEMDAAGVDSGELWDDLLATEGDAGPVVTGEPVETSVERDVRIVDDRLCHRCQYFGDPPELHCTHEGTDILEVVDIDQYKIADCPMVGDDEPGVDAEVTAEADGEQAGDADR